MISIRAVLRTGVFILSSLGSLHAASIIGLTSYDDRSLTIVGTALEFRYTTGSIVADKALQTEQFVGSSSVAASGASATYTDTTYVTAGIVTGIAAGSTVTAATMDFAAIVLQAIALSAPAFEASPKSFSTSSFCAGGTVATSGSGGNCTADGVRISATGALYYLKSITVGGTTHTFSGSGLAIPTVGASSVDMASVEGTTNFLSALGAGGTISMTWTQAVTLTGSAQKNGSDVDPPMNMTCRDCTVYFAGTTSASQDTRLQSVFSAKFTPPEGAALIAIPEPASFALIGAGLAGLALLRRRFSR